tara:strand:+ start:414 stop:2480 length:2067 start_codon:yes stop_codon:yes gene_type:complete
VLNPGTFNEKEYDRERKAKQRAQGRVVYIPVPKNIERRLACLADPELLLTTHFRMTYYEPFTDDRRDMLRSIYRAAEYGGDQAIAGSRGEGKTTLAMDGAFCLMLARLSGFPVVIGKNQDSSSGELLALRERILMSESFIEDFPEIGIPLQSVGPSTANARLQTVGGEFIRMYLGPKHFAFPTITNEQLPHWPKELESIAQGQVMGAIGIDGRVRGFKFRSLRPTLALIDDIEDKESANSDTQIEKIESIIEEDIGGMGSSAERIARVYLCTTLNRKCNAFKYTDRKQKGSWNGRRYRKMIRRPDRMDLVTQYIELRRFRDEADPDARDAFRFWRDNQAEIEAGCQVSNPYSYSKKIHADGEPMELSTCHAYFNKVADFGEKAVATEIDNDPPEEVGPQGNGLTAQTIVKRIGDYGQGDAPETTLRRTAAIDLGNYKSHWVATAWEGNAVGSIFDYGIAKTYGVDPRSDNKTIELAIIDMLERWADEVMAKINPVICFVDSGSGKGRHTAAAYEFCRRRGKPFFPSKGYATSRFRMPERAPGLKEPFLEAWAHYLVEEKVWLYNVHTEWWKPWVHQRFLTEPYNEDGSRNAGSLTLYDPNGVRNEHNLFANHIVAEGEQTINGKTTFVQFSDENHYLDALALACAGAGSVGVRLIEQYRPEPKPQPERKPVDNDRFKKRPGGWIPRKR